MWSRVSKALRRATGQVSKRSTPHEFGDTAPGSPYIPSVSDDLANVTAEQIAEQQEKDDDYIERMNKVFHSNIQIEMEDAKPGGSIFPENANIIKRPQDRQPLPKERISYDQQAEENSRDTWGKLTPEETMYVMSSNKSHPKEYDTAYVQKKFGVDQKLMQHVLDHCSAPLIVLQEGSQQRFGFWEITDGTPYVIMGHVDAKSQATAIIDEQGEEGDGNQAAKTRRKEARARQQRSNARRRAQRETRG
jgi:hypothetical protein